MKKIDLIGFGIPEEKIPGFQKIYWADVKKQAAIQLKAEQEKDAVPSLAAVRDAVAAMLSLVYDPVRLTCILETVSREYHYQEKERARKAYEGQVEELRQKIAQGKREEQQAKQLTETDELDETEQAVAG